MWRLLQVRTRPVGPWTRLSSALWCAAGKTPENLEYTTNSRRLMKSASGVIFPRVFHAHTYVLHGIRSELLHTEIQGVTVTRLNNRKGKHRGR